MRPDDLHIRTLQTQIASSNQAAFASLFRLFYPRLHSFSLQYVHVHEVAEEITNDVFVKLWNRRADLLQIQNLSTYLFVAVKNYSLNYLKQYSHIHVVIEDQEGAAGLINRNNPAQELEWKEICFELNQAIEQLPDQCRTVFKLVKEEGFKYKEVAEILGLSPRTVETQLFRALKKLQAVANVYLENAGRKPRKNPPPISSLAFLPLLSLFF
ncbi:RNA polymerase sigma-70 factor [Paraflavitalea sp. CAU 1676]|uniref:RNA polymerase sigma-70 factor n=1 Tax=Paraflavitalea sp. CAU 1676 TaxID=3032598 RepID=UPI0023DBD237|nr:RNA polymerase sigma-70 factor [Paraflavitalea sp. CAU 1676]MDF2188369.1 RNA polymerase sigma-70 factor [Paraflavitalea sp. CAU 1676]